MKLPFEIDLKDKVAVVTGGGGILCSSFAEAIAKSGAKVAVLDLNPDAANAVAESIVANGGTAIGVKTNVLDKKSLEEAMLFQGFSETINLRIPCGIFSKEEPRKGRPAHLPGIPSPRSEW